MHTSCVSNLWRVGGTGQYFFKLITLNINTLILNDNNIICEMLREEKEFEDKLLLIMISKKRNVFNSILSTRKTE